MTQQIRTTITSTVRGRSNKDGNPRYTVHTTDGSYPTADGGQVGYGITNSEYQGEVILTLENGVIVGVSTVDGQYFSGKQA